MNRRDYKPNRRTDLLVALALIVAVLGLTGVVVLTLLQINYILVG